MSKYHQVFIEEKYFKITFFLIRLGIKDDHYDNKAFSSLLKKGNFQDTFSQ